MVARVALDEKRDRAISAILFAPGTRFDAAAKHPMAAYVGRSQKPIGNIDTPADTNDVARRAAQGRPILPDIVMTIRSIELPGSHAAVLETTLQSRTGMDRYVPVFRNNSLLP